MQIEVDGNRINCEIVGSGDPLLVVHGGMGHGHGYFRPWLDALSAHRQLIYVDLPGDGLSEAPPGHGEWADLGPIIGALHGLKKALGFERWTVLGHSFGGFVVQTYALTYPGDFDGLVVCCSSPVVDHFEASFAAAEQHATPEQIKALTERLFHPMADDAEFDAVWSDVFPVYFAHSERIDFSALDAGGGNAAAFNASLRILPNVDVLDRLGELRMPTLVLGATKDWTFPPPVGAQRIHARIPGSEYVEFAESGHYPFIEESEAFVGAVGDWLARTPSGAAAVG